MLLFEKMNMLHAFFKKISEKITVKSLIQSDFLESRSARFFQCGRRNNNVRKWIISGKIKYRNGDNHKL